MSLQAYNATVLQQAAGLSRQIAREESTRLRWATVVSTDPLSIRYDGEVDPSVVPPQTLSQVQVGERVQVARFRGQAIIVGVGGGRKAFVPRTLTTEDLNDVTEAGLWFQQLNVDATLARNYPPQAAYAGVLTVHRPYDGYIFQIYQTYGSTNTLAYRAYYDIGGGTGWYPWRMALPVEENGNVEHAGQIAASSVGSGWATIASSVTTGGGALYFGPSPGYTSGYPFIRQNGQGIQFNGASGNEFSFYGGAFARFANRVDCDGFLYANSRMAMTALTDTTNSANMHISSSGIVYHSTSAARAKLCVTEASTPPEALLAASVREWVDKGEAERYAEDQGTTVDELDLESLCGVEPEATLRRIPGLIAEELEAIGLGQFVIYEEDPDNPGEMRTSGVMYDRLWTLLVPLAREQRDRIEELEARVDTQQAALDDLAARLRALEAVGGGV